MSGIRKIYFILVLIALQTVQAFSQNVLLKRNDLLPEIREILSLTYGFDFTLARKKLADIQKEIPEHPATTFLEALIIYWENYPLTLQNKNSSAFLKLMEETSLKAESMVEKNPDDLEGIFFALYSRAFYIMFWSDNGKPFKVFPYLNFLYKQTIKGMERKFEFVEFYFSSGLYNYYIEAYPDKHPVYKPVKILFRNGNKTEGLQELGYCAENAVYLRIEAKYFLSLLYLGYENNPKKASEIAAELYKEFPKNICYIGNYANTLLFDKKYSIAEIIIQNMAKNTDTFSLLQRHIHYGYLLEKYKKDYTGSLQEYQSGLELTEEFGENANLYKALAWMGIGRDFKRKGNMAEASRYFKLARTVSSYNYVINDQ
jgi:hypothetical protein